MSRRSRRNRRTKERAGHAETRSMLRLFGFVALAVGGVFGLIGLADFFSAFGDFDKTPTKFWMIFIALPLVGAGIAMLQAGYRRQILQYHMREAAPAVVETFDDVALGTKDSVRQLAGAIGEGLRGEAGSNTQACPSCNHANSADARFCDDCGTALARACAACNEPNDGDAKFCNACGAKFA